MVKGERYKFTKYGLDWPNKPGNKDLVVLYVSLEPFSRLQLYVSWDAVPN